MCELRYFSWIFEGEKGLFRAVHDERRRQHAGAHEVTAGWGQRAAERRFWGSTALARQVKDDANGHLQPLAPKPPFFPPKKPPLHHSRDAFGAPK